MRGLNACEIEACRMRHLNTHSATANWRSAHEDVWRVISPDEIKKSILAKVEKTEK
jgi:hypothetical protein